MFLSMDDPTFWSRCPEELKPLLQGGLDASYFLMGERKDDPPTVIALKLAPNAINVRHAHDCWRFEVVVQGTLDVGDRVLKPGDVMLTEPKVAYGPHVAGPEGCVTFEIFSNYRASHVTLLEEAGQLVECDIATSAGLAKMQSIMATAGAG
jgi:anti-sigma factor ChrR (cupin superfamily)